MPFAGQLMSEVRVIACFGSMVLVSGMERMSFEVLRVLKENGAKVHCILNSWENHRIQKLVDSIGASWSTGYYWYRFDRHTRSPLKILQMVWDVLLTSAGLLRDAVRFRATHVFVPEHASVLRNAPALAFLRVLGKTVILRLANAPERGGFYDRLWRWVVPSFTTHVIANSEFAMQRCLEARVPRSKLILIKNRVSPSFRPADDGSSVVDLVRSAKTLLCVGQIAPFKGTHLAIAAALSLMEQGADVQLVIVGAVPEWPPELVDYYQELQAKVQASRYSDRVHFLGTRTDVLEIMKHSYLLLAPILQEETFGNVVLEAKSVGLPVVAFRRGGIPELIEDGVTGHLCDGFTAESLAAGSREFLESPQIRERASAASLASLSDPLCEFSPSMFNRKWLELFGIGNDELAIAFEKI
jgi:glycosyltransferase involved in cell wall biosynthesis